MHARTFAACTHACVQVRALELAADNPDGEDFYFGLDEDIEELDDM